MMKLSNTLIMNENLLPSNKQAFTLAEVLITLSILGIVAALTIPSLINRQSDAAAIVKLKKAISTYENMAGVYMVENETTSLAGAIADCDTAEIYFKVTNAADITGGGCIFTTGDGVLWVFPNSGNPVVVDSQKNPRFAVTMYASGGEVNAKNTTTITDRVPAASLIPNVADIKDTAGGAVAPQSNRYYSVENFLNDSTKDIIAGTHKVASPRKAVDSSAEDDSE